MKKKIAVLLAGCGRLDGSEIHESVLTLLSIVQNAAEYQCFSINKKQYRVFNHLTNTVEDSQERNMIVESSRIARGDIMDISDLSVDIYDALIIPGGDGVAYNFFDLNYKSENYSVEESIKNICNKFTKKKKPVGFICISPAMIPLIYGEGIELTIGNDEKLIKILNKLGSKHRVSNVCDVVVDIKNKIYSTPAYMLAKDINEVYISIKNLVDLLVREINN